MKSTACGNFIPSLLLLYIYNMYLYFGDATYICGTQSPLTIDCVSKLVGWCCWRVGIYLVAFEKHRVDSISLCARATWWWCCCWRSSFLCTCVYIYPILSSVEFEVKCLPAMFGQGRCLLMMQRCLQRVSWDSSHFEVRTNECLRKMSISLGFGNYFDYIIGASVKNSFSATFAVTFIATCVCVGLYIVHSTSCWVCP